MVGDRHVLVAAPYGRFRHFLDCVAAIGLHGVHVHIALQIPQLDKCRQRVLFRGLNLAKVFPQLRSNVVEIKFRVDLFFGFAGNRLLGLQIGEGVFIERVTHL